MIVSKSTVKTAVFGIVLLAVATSIFGLMMYWVFAQGEKLTKQIVVIEEERAQEASYFRLRKMADESELDRVLLASHFLTKEGDSIDFLNLVEGLAAKMGVELETEGLSTITAKDESSKWIETQFAFSASREKVLAFIKVLESLPYVSRVTAVDMAARSTTDWHAEVTMQVRILSS